MKLLFITHNSHRAGAQKVLLLFLQWLKNNTDYEFDVLDLNPGVLQDDFKAVCQKYYSIDNSKNTNKPLGQVIKRLYKLYNYNVLRTIINESYNIVYANTVKTIPIGVHIKQKSKQCKLLVHVHELEVAIKLLLPDITKYLNEIDHTLAVSNTVKKQLSNHFGFNKLKLSMVYAFSDTKNQAIKKEVAKSNFCIGASGHIDWRKGSDIFLQVARYFFKKNPKAKVDFIWVGYISSQDRLILEADIFKLGLTGKVKFVGEQKNPALFYQNFDVFLMTSREDPFPLVCIEVGQLGTPIVCFENAVGTAEIIKKGGGKLVPYLDIEEMSKALLLYYEQPEKLLADSLTAKSLFAHFTVDKQAPKLLQTIHKLIS